jgi:elongation factor Ts
MAEVTAALVKELREKTGAGMMDCKRALAETNGDLEAAVDWLRKKGFAAAAKKAGRVASEGLVGFAVDAHAGALVEVNAETDFVGRNESFQNFVRAVAKLVLAQGDDVEKLKALPFPGSSRSVAEELTHMISTIGENMSLRRAKRLAVKSGHVAPYMHAALAPGLGKIGVLVALESNASPDKLTAPGRNLAMHVAAANPRYVTSASVDSVHLERERGILREQAKASGKPDAIIDKMVEGRLKKFYEDVVLLEQLYVIDGESRVVAVLDHAAKDAGAPVHVAGFVRFALGEGIEKVETDFAAEVAATAKVTR